MELRVGTSGFSYKEWKGSFYPEDLPAGEMLAHYGTRLPAVEINNTFYRLPRQSVLESWAEQVPERFRFVLKASRRITHFGKLKGVEDETRYLLSTVAAGLGARAGAILFQLPPRFGCDLDRLEAFLDLLPRSARAAFEFRHPSWLEEERTRELLATRGVAICLAETDESPVAELPATGAPASSADTAGEPRAGPDWGYLRLRKIEYSDADLAAWAERIRETGWGEAYVFFKHEDAGLGPRYALRLRELLEEEG